MYQLDHAAILHVRQQAAQSLHIMWNSSSSGLPEHEYLYQYNGQYFIVEGLEVLVFIRPGLVLYVYIARVAQATKDSWAPLPDAWSSSQTIFSSCLGPDEDFDDNALSCMMVMVSYGDYYDLKFLVVLFMFHDNFDDNDLVDHQSSWFYGDDGHHLQDLDVGDDDDDDDDDLVDDVLEGTGWAGLGRITDLGTL